MRVGIPGDTPKVHTKEVPRRTLKTFLRESLQNYPSDLLLKEGLIFFRLVAEEIYEKKSWNNPRLICWLLFLILIALSRTVNEVVPKKSVLICLRFEDLHQGLLFRVPMIF